MPPLFRPESPCSRDETCALRLASATWLRRLWDDPRGRRWTDRICQAVIARRHLLEGGRLEAAALRMIASESSCCPRGSSHHELVDRYLDLHRGTRARTLVEGLLSRLGPEAGGRRAAAVLRAAVLWTLRQEDLAARGTWDPWSRPGLVEVQLAIFPDCRLACRGCYARARHGGPVPDEDYLRWVLGQAWDAGAVTVHLAGHGEPFLDDGRARLLCRLVEGFPHLLFSVTTDGQGMPPWLARRLAEADNLLVLVSLDGPKPVHDARRGAGTHDCALRSLGALADAGALVGFAAMVSEANFRAITEPALLRDLVSRGCCAGVLSRYFPLGEDAFEALQLSPSSRAEYRGRLATLVDDSPIPLWDFDELEARTGCRSRDGAAIYVDGLSGQVAPCLRMPFAPAECRLDADRGRTLNAVLAHPFFEAYRKGGGCAAWCGARPGEALDRLAGLLEPYGPISEDLRAYRRRCDPVFDMHKISDMHKNIVLNQSLKMDQEP